ncbi:MAG: HlyD family efflux transporter periplasmic adaptor subunit [Rhodobiaceae bacterium]|nr:HlyD family efflux transporter periplasmic adaptor subunit [Rhodobiaceae bacterium]MCC0054650.1 HlyD family efflux transporter periplasmic adaptor subunit [Rhodobiaceae bacterium]
MKGTVRWIVGIAIAALVAGGFWLALRQQPALVDTARIASGPMTVTIDQEGRTRVREIYTVSSPIAGHLSRTTLDVGDAVKANETVVASIHPLDPPLIDRRAQAELRAAVEAARSAVVLAQAERERAKAALDLAAGDLERAESLSRTSVISQRALEKAVADRTLAEAQLRSAEATIKVREAELESAEARLLQPSDVSKDASSDCCVNLTSPSDGVVLEVLTKSEQAVTAGAQIATIGDPRNLEIVVDLLSSDAVQIKPGMNAVITDWGGVDLPAHVRRIDPSGFTKVSALGIEEQRVNAILDFDEPAPALGHGFRIYARLAVWRGDDILQVPISALFRHEGAWSVYRIVDGKAVLTGIDTGHMNDDVAEVLKGLTAGDVVIVHPSDEIEDGRGVEPRPAS